MAAQPTVSSPAPSRVPSTRLVLGIVVLMVLMASGCNTTKGFGKDLERGGQNLQDAADRNR